MDTEYIFEREIDCKQGAVRSVRFSGRRIGFVYFPYISLDVCVMEANGFWLLVDGSYCITCGSDRKLKLWNPYKPVTLKTYGGHGDEVMDACASCDSSQIVSCGLDKSVIIWDVSTGVPVRRFRGHAGPVTTVR